MAELKSRLATLPDDAAVYYGNLYADDAGATFIPVDVVPLLAQASNRPIVSDNVFHMGRGSAGGFLALPEPIARDAARRVLRVLDGEPASRLPITAGDFTRPIFDWRQLERWGINAASLPPGSEIRFRPPTLWEQYRWQMIAILVAVLLQAAAHRLAAVRALSPQARRGRIARPHARSHSFEPHRRRRRPVRVDRARAQPAAGRDSQQRRSRGASADGEPSRSRPGAGDSRRHQAGRSARGRHHPAPAKPAEAQGRSRAAGIRPERCDRRRNPYSFA